MIEKIWEYLKRSVTVAWKSVFFNFKQYFCFFLAVMIVQVLYGMVVVSADNGNRAQYNHITEEYDYHIVLKGLNDDQARYITNYGASPFKSDQFYDVVKYERFYHAITGDILSDVFLHFNTGEPEDCLKRFEKTYQQKIMKMGEKGESFTKSLSPLMQYEDTKRSDNASFFFITLLLLVLCVFLLTSLYRIRINHYRFEYGIYLTFGADFKMLYSTAFWELFIIMIVTFIPSVLLSAVLSHLIYAGSSYGFVFRAGTVFKVFLFTLVTILASVFTPMRLMSVKQPMSLIIAEDNSNLVVSPRTSFSIFREKFPRKYEFYSLWRFRKYNIQVLTTAIVFCALFIMGLYMSDITKTQIDYPRPQLTVTLEDTGYIYDETMSSELYDIDGVRAVEIDDNEMEAFDAQSHVLVNKKDARLFTPTVPYNGRDFDAGNENWGASNAFVYKAMNEEQLGILEYYDYSGDLNCIFKDGYVVVGDSKSNIKAYNFEVGDKIAVAVKVGQYRAVDSDESGNILLQSQIKYFRYEYREYTVGAVIYNIPCESTPIFMSNSEYEIITGEEPGAKNISIYASDDLDDAGIEQLYTDVREWAHSYGDILVFDKHESLDRIVSEDRHYAEIFIVISLMILVISPIVWFFSQALYYSKREKEFNILQSVGAVLSEIRQMCLQGGLTMASLSLVFSIILSYLGSYLLYLFYNVAMPFFTGETIRYSFYMPWYAILISVVLSVACGFLATYMPFRSYAKYRRSLENGGAGAEFGAEE